MLELISVATGVVGVLITLLLERRRLSEEIRQLWEEARGVQLRRPAPARRPHAPAPFYPDINAAPVNAVNAAPINAPPDAVPHTRPWGRLLQSIVLSFLRVLVAMLTSTVVLPVVFIFMKPDSALLIFGSVLVGVIFGGVFLRKQSWRVILLTLAGAIVALIVVIVVATAIRMSGNPTGYLPVSHLLS